LEDFLNMNIPPDLKIRLEILPFLHYGFAALNLIYIPLGILALNLLETLIQLEEVSALLIAAYGTDFSFMLGGNSWLHTLSIIYFIISAGLNIWAARSFEKPRRYKYIRQVEWLNMGLIPLGTALAIISLSALKSLESLTPPINQSTKEL
jgi:hypothetical protein